MSTIHKLSWTNVEDNIRDIVEKTPQPQIGLIAIARGGFIPTSLLIQSWPSVHVASIRIQHYGKDKKPLPSAYVSDLSLCAGVGKGAGWYLVDDIVDEGATMAKAKEIFPEAQTLAIAHKGRCQAPDYFAFQVMDPELWIKFPWEPD